MCNKNYGWKQILLPGGQNTMCHQAVDFLIDLFGNEMIEYHFMKLYWTGHIV